jgi:hypothetical protein
MNNYLQIEIGGELRGLKFNMLSRIEAAKKVDFERLESTTLYAYVYAGLLANAYVKQVEFNTDYETVCDWVDAIPTETQIEIIGKINQIFGTSEQSEKPETTTEEKKSNRKTMKANV